jgi:hypothetical protein
VFGLALRQTEAMSGSVIGLLGLDSRYRIIPPRRVKTLEVPRAAQSRNPHFCRSRFRLGRSFISANPADAGSV